MMNDLALLEKYEGRSMEIPKSFFRIDYVTKHMLGSFFRFTFCYLLVMVLVLLYSIQDILETVNVMDVVSMFIKYIWIYIIGLIVYEAITVLVYAVRYNRSKKLQKVRTARLKRLAKRYEADGNDK